MQAKAILLALILSTAVGFPIAASAASTTVTVTLASPTMTARVSRNGIPSDCSAAKAFPGTIATTVGYAVSPALTNASSQPVCTLFTLTTSASCAVNVFATAYLGSFNPANLAANYLGDPGASSAVSSFTAIVPANASVVFALSYTTTSPTEDCTMSITTQPVLPPTVPALDLRLLGLLGLMLAAMSCIRLHRSQR